MNYIDFFYTNCAGYSLDDNDIRVKITQATIQYLID